MRLAKYTKTPISFFLELPIGEFYDWVGTMNREIELENKTIKQMAAHKHGRK